MSDIETNLYVVAFLLIFGFGAGVITVLTVQDWQTVERVELQPAANPQPAVLQLSCDRRGMEEHYRICRARKRMEAVK